MGAALAEQQDTATHSVPSVEASVSIHDQDEAQAQEYEPVAVTTPQRADTPMQDDGRSEEDVQLTPGGSFFRFDSRFV